MWHSLDSSSIFLIIMIQVCDSYYWSVEVILALLFGCLDLDKETFTHLLLNPSPVSKKDLSNTKGKKTKKPKMDPKGKRSSQLTFCTTPEAPGSKEQSSKYRAERFNTEKRTKGQRMVKTKAKNQFPGFFQPRVWTSPSPSIRQAKQNKTMEKPIIW